MTSVPWATATLGDACRFQAGGAFPRAEQGLTKGDVPFIKVSDMNLPTNSKKIRTANNWVSFEAASRMKAKLVPEGAVVFAKIGEALKAERLREITRPTAIDNNMMAAIAKPTVDPKFLSYLLEHVHLASWAEGSALPFLRQGDLVRVPVMLPPLVEQRGIAMTLCSLDDKIESNRRAQALIESIVRAHFDRLFDVSLDTTGLAVSELVEVNPRRALARGSAATYVGMSSLPEFSAEIYDWETRIFSSGQRFINGDVLMARITPCLENGKTAVVDMLKASEVGWGSTEYIVLGPKGEFSTPWIYCLVRSEEVRGFAIRSMTGTSGRQRFQSSGFDGYKIPAPGANALIEFNKLSLPLFERMTQLRDENRALSTLRDALVPELLSGRARVPEADGALR